MAGRTCEHRQRHSRVYLLLACCAALTISTQLSDGQETTASQWKLARELIHDTPSPGHPADPMTTIRVVNCLQALGKEKAIALLFEITDAMLSIQGGIPFRICGDWTYSGEAPEPRPLVEWAAKHGKLRDKPLEPQDDPLEAADALYSRIRAGECWEFSNCWQVGPRDIPDSWMRDDLRAQAING